MSWRSRILQLIPSREQLATGRFTRWLAPWLGQRRLWRLSRQGVALGMAIGIFFGLLVPVAQIPMSAAAAIALRANLPAAMGSTLVTNPVTFGPIYFLAYKTGRRLTGQSADVTPADVAQVTKALVAQAEAQGEKTVSYWRRLQALGKPLFVGLGVFAVAGGLLTYALVSGLWWLWQRLRSRRRRAALAGRSMR